MVRSWTDADNGWIPSPSLMLVVITALLYVPTMTWPEAQR
jgi:hypothetical protein